MSARENPETPGTFMYTFEFRTKLYKKKGYATEKDAEKAEAALRKRLRNIEDGVELEAGTAPKFTNWAGVYWTWVTSPKAKQRRIPDTSTVIHHLQMVLRFFGARPEQIAPRNRFDQRGFRDTRPYHNLTLADVVRDRTWITKFEDWMILRGIKGSTRNKYRAALRRMYWLAASVEYRNDTGITVNPFAEIQNDPNEKRYTRFGSDANLVAVRAAAAPHIQLAMDIALYAVKFRRGSILNLEWSQGPKSKAWISADWQYLVSAQHKTWHHTGRPQVAILSPQLKRILLATKKRQEKTNTRLTERYGEVYSTCNHVVQWGGRPVKDIKRGLRAACVKAGVPYGLQRGITFHSLKHEQGTQAVLIPGMSDSMRRAIIGDSTESAASIYKELVPEHERAAVLAMAKATDARLARGQRALDEAQTVCYERSSSGSVSGMTRGSKGGDFNPKVKIFRPRKKAVSL